MANMSYCRFRNTLSDLQDCIDAINEAGSIEEMEEQLQDSPDELRAFKQMVEMMIEFYQDNEHEIQLNN